MPYDLTHHPEILLPLMLWEGIWKGFALWRAARSGHLYWFVALLIINSAGILPILYLFVFNRKPSASQAT